jgi:hypothetical protein
MAREAFWRQVVMTKYGSSDNGWTSRMPKGPYGVTLWKYIRLGWDKFYHLIKFEVGYGTKIKFWDDVWCGDEPLKNSFLELYCIAFEKDAYVSDHINIRDKSVHWEVNFTQLAHD